ncbi:MAG: hypothetical protein FJZ05_01835, partial [Candidatus Nealsonbacteria bacterium]|nr:hypothetical protein [Candidatus Nealsonbacteria bacterium]
RKIQYWNNLLASEIIEFRTEIIGQSLASMNSYLGIMKAYNTYKLRKKMLMQILSENFKKYFSFSSNYTKFSAKK